MENKIKWGIISHYSRWPLSHLQKLQGLVSQQTEPCQIRFEATDAHSRCGPIFSAHARCAGTLMQLLSRSRFLTCLDNTYCAYTCEGGRWEETSDPCRRGGNCTLLNDVTLTAGVVFRVKYKQVTKKNEVTNPNDKNMILTSMYTWHTASRWYTPDLHTVTIRT